MAWVLCPSEEELPKSGPWGRRGGHAVVAKTRSHTLKWLVISSCSHRHLGRWHYCPQFIEEETDLNIFVLLPECLSAMKRLWCPSLPSLVHVLSALLVLAFSLSPSFLSPPPGLFPSSRVLYLIKYFDLQIAEDYSKGRCKNGYLRHTDSNILDYDGAHIPGGPGERSLEEGELVNLLAPFFNEKATSLLESR